MNQADRFARLREASLIEEGRWEEITRRDGRFAEAARQARREIA